MKTLKELRIERGLTQQQVGDVMGCTGSAVANYEKGVHSPTVDTVPALAALFNISVEQMVGALLFDPFATVARELGIERHQVQRIYARVNELYEAAREPEPLRLVAG